MKLSGKEGFSSATCLVVLALSVLRVAFWVVGRVRNWSYMVYSIMLTLMQFYLLEAIISARRKKQAAGALASRPSWPRRGDYYGATSAVLARNLKKLVTAWLRGDREGATALWRRLRLSFWAWDELPPYVEVVVVMSLHVAVISVAALRVVSRDAYSRFIGTCVAACDVLVAAPQLRMNCARQDTTGLSTLMVAAWFFRDLLLLLDQRTTSQQNEQLGALNNTSLKKQVVSSPRTLLAVFRVAADALVLAQIAIFSSATYWRAANLATDPLANGEKQRRTHQRWFGLPCCPCRFRRKAKKQLSAYFMLHGAAPRGLLQGETLGDAQELDPLVGSDDDLHRNAPSTSCNGGAPLPASMCGTGAGTNSPAEKVSATSVSHSKAQSSAANQELQKQARSAASKDGATSTSLNSPPSPPRSNLKNDSGR